MLITYQERDFKPASMAIIETANEILADYRSQGFDMTLRQLYYQFVSKDLIPNTERSYKNLGTLISNARIAGLVSWHDINDRNRYCSHWPCEENEAEVVNGLEYGLNMDRWARQDNYIEVWVEKDALSGVIERACNPFRLPHMACKGYLSQSEAWRSGRRFMHAIEEGKTPILLHLGDHDPSGLDMTRDNGDRLEMFAEQGVEVRRLALNIDQVDEYGPPPNPAKVTDSRAAEYIKRYGSSSWELDALEPSVIVDLIKAEVEPLINWDRWRSTDRTQFERRARLSKIGDHWDRVSEFLDTLD